MQARILKEEDYDKLCKWWKDWRWTPPPYDMLPNTGIMLSSNGRDVCAGFVYFTNSKAAWVEFIVSDFEYRESDRKECLIFLVNTLSELAKENGSKYIYTSLKSKSLIDVYSECGYILGSTNCNEMVKILCQQ